MDAVGHFVRLVLYKNHINTLNIYSQVGHDSDAITIHVHAWSSILIACQFAHLITYMYMYILASFNNTT